ncbi:MAG: DUF2325 domain-containing protein [Lachnospiraceae bacterium]|nr:DUF2325 domain-containing protein [Lachnospiraceae bacterium]
MQKDRMQDTIRQVSRHHKIYLIGGNQNLTKKLRNRYPDIRCYHSERKSSCGAMITNADLVMFKYDSLCHAMSAKVQGIAEAKKIPCAYISPVTSMELLEHEIYEKMVDAGLTEETGSEERREGS